MNLSGAIAAERRQVCAPLPQSSRNLRSDDRLRHGDWPPPRYHSCPPRGRCRAAVADIARARKAARRPPRYHLLPAGYRRLRTRRHSRVGRCSTSRKTAPARHWRRCAAFARPASGSRPPERSMRKRPPPGCHPDVRSSSPETRWRCSTGSGAAGSPSLLRHCARLHSAWPGLRHKSRQGPSIAVATPPARWRRFRWRAQARGRVLLPRCFWPIGPRRR